MRHLTAGWCRQLARALLVLRPRRADGYCSAWQAPRARTESRRSDSHHCRCSHPAESAKATSLVRLRLVPGSPPRARDGGSQRPHCRALFVLGERVENLPADPLLGRDVNDRPEQGERSALAVDRVLARRERDVPAIAPATFPDAEPDQLQPG